MMTIAADTYAAMEFAAHFEDAAGALTDSFVLERRAGARVKIARPIKVVERSNGRHIAGRSRDVSPTGMRLQIPLTHTIREGDTVQVDVGLLSGIGPLAHRPRLIPARVIWIRKEQKLLRPLLTAGVEFEPDRDAAANVA